MTPLGFWLTGVDVWLVGTLSTAFGVVVGILDWSTLTKAVAAITWVLGLGAFYLS